MSRLGISFNDVYSAVNELRKKKKNVTIDTVRQTLGNRGSYTTISKYLRAVLAIDGDEFSEAINDEERGFIRGFNAAIEKVTKEINEFRKYALKEKK